MRFAAVILAAGKGSRMNSDLPKVMHRLAGVPLVDHALNSAVRAGADSIHVVVGHGGDSVAEHLAAKDPDIAIHWQRTQNGTGHAVQQVADALAGYDGDVIVLYGDTPFVRPETLHAMQKARENAQVVVLGFNAKDPAGYGRLVMQGDSLEAIVEHKDCTEAQRAIRFCNSGVVCAPAALLFSLLDEVGTDNASAEVYLTDIVAIARGRGLPCTAIACKRSETLGINTRQELAHAEKVFQKRARKAAQANGVAMVAPKTVHFALDTVLGRDITIEPNVFFGPDVTVENGAGIRAFSHLEGCHISQNAQIGPYARLRPGAEIGASARVGNFVEIKAAGIGNGAKVNHLSYVGDASVGAKTNIGAGVIFCNYDGVNKHRSTLGESVFVGSNSALVSPVEIGDEALIGTGSVVTQNVPAGDLVLARAKQVNKAGRGKRLMDLLRTRKNK